MRIFYKYLLWLLSASTIVIFYLLNTQVGHENLGLFLGKYLSEKTKNEIKIIDYNMDDYPVLEINLTVNDGAKVFLKGKGSPELIDMDYHLIGEDFNYSSFYTEDRVDIKGHISGISSNRIFTGVGELLEGKGEFEFIKTSENFKDINLSLMKVSSLKLFKLLEQKPYLHGEIDVDAKMKLFSTQKRLGEVKLHMDKGALPDILPSLSFVLDTNLTFKNIEIFYDGKIYSEKGFSLLTKGVYHRSRKEALFDYVFDIKELSPFSTIFHHNYKGALHTLGKVQYANQKFEINGTSTHLGGNLAYHYKDKNIEFDLEGVFLSELLKQLSYPALFNSEVYGMVDYNLKDNVIIVNTKLKKTRFRRTKMTDKIYETTGIDMLKEIYDDSSFVGGYQNKILSSILKIDNGVNHIYLTDTRMNAKTNAIDSKFEIRLEGEELSGTIYGTLKKPKISIDVSRLLRYKFDKQLEDWFGETEQEKVKQKFNGVKHKLETIDIDEVRRKAKATLDKLF